MSKRSISLPGQPPTYPPNLERDQLNGCQDFREAVRITGPCLHPDHHKLEGCSFLCGSDLVDLCMLMVEFYSKNSIVNSALDQNILDDCLAFASYFRLVNQDGWRQLRR